MPNSLRALSYDVVVPVLLVSELKHPQPQSRLFDSDASCDHVSERNAPVFMVHRETRHTCACLDADCNVIPAGLVHDVTSMMAYFWGTGTMVHPNNRKDKLGARAEKEPVSSRHRTFFLRFLSPFPGDAILEVCFAESQGHSYLGSEQSHLRPVQFPDDGIDKLDPTRPERSLPLGSRSRKQVGATAPPRIASHPPLLTT